MKLCRKKLHWYEPVLGSNKGCPECREIYEKDRNEARKKDPEYLKYQADYKKEHREDAKKYANDLYWEDPEKSRKEAQDRVKANPEKKKASSKKSREKHRDKLLIKNAIYREENKEELKKQKKIYLQSVQGKGKKNANVAKRKAAKKQRTPKWLTPEDHQKTEMLYMIAAAMTKQSGVPYHVDHIVPIQGENVSGLHVWWNLQVILGSENVRKNNKF